MILYSKVSKYVIGRKIQLCIFLIVFCDSDISWISQTIIYTNMLHLLLHVKLWFHTARTFCSCKGPSYYNHATILQQPILLYPLYFQYLLENRSWLKSVRKPYLAEQVQVQDFSLHMWKAQFRALEFPKLCDLIQEVQFYSG